MVRRTVFFLYSFTALSLHAQPSTLKFDNIGLDQGLSESIVLAITQDTQGYMWFGTADGLNRFDGYEFKVPQAKNIWVEVRFAADCRLRIAVRDDGIGMQNGTGDSLSRQGVLNMRKRAEEIGAAFTIVSNGKGMEVNLELPIGASKS